MPVNWHEAVAVVRQVGLQATGGRDTLTSLVKRDEGRVGPDLQWPPSRDDVASVAIVETSGTVPEADGVWLTSEGTVKLDAPSSRTRETVPALAELLRALLPPTAPSDLLAIADPESLKPQPPSAQEFLAALTFFARPDDSAEVQALVARAFETQIARERADALRTLTERTRHAEPTSAPEPKRPAKPFPYKQLARVVLLVALVAVAGLGAWWALTRVAPVAETKGTAATQPISPARRVQEGLASAAAFVTDALGTAPAQSPGKGADVQLPAPRRPRRPAAQEPEATPALEPANAAPVFRAPEGREASGAPPEGDLPAGDGVRQAVATVPQGVFGAEHLDVVPPAPVRAQMPAVPIGGVPNEARGLLELMVAEDGQVVSARLVPASNRYQDRMMVSAAKTWRFTPAMRNGQPVRYRLQMPITW